MKKIWAILLVSVCFCFHLDAQVVAVKTNLFYDAMTTMNLGAEVAFNKHLTLDVSGNYNPWTLSNDQSFRHWLVQPEFRYWIHEKFNGHFFGIHGIYTDIDCAGKDFMSIIDSKYDGYGYGGGVSYGYQLYISPHWNIEFTAGFGFVYFEYDKSSYPADGVSASRYRNNYIGPTKVGISIMYIIK